VAFKKEEEFRIVYSDAYSDGIWGELIRPAFRGHPLIPFVRLGMRDPKKRLPVASIRLGPAAAAGKSGDANVSALKRALAELGLSGVDVLKSDIPYVPRNRG